MSVSNSSETSPSTLSRFPLASFQEVFMLSLPLILCLFSASLLNFFDRLFLSHYSLDAWIAASTAGNVSFLYQISCSMIALIAQAFIGQNIGANKLSKVGPIVWQMIWFAFLSMIVTYPTSFLAESYFVGTDVEQASISYFRPMALFNFLFPLASALTAFFIGRGKTRIILVANLIIQALNVCLDYLLIFGFDPLIPSMGVKGAAYATLLSQFCLCLVLFYFFSRPKYDRLYRTDKKKFDFVLFKEILAVGLPRSIGRCIGVAAWTFAAHMLIEKGGDSLLVLTLGVSLFTSFTFINEGFSQAITTIISHVLGANKVKILPLLFRSSFQMVSLSILVLSVPLIFCSDFFIHIFIQEKIHPDQWELLRKTCFCIWLVCLANGFNAIGASLVTASRDTVFYAWATCANWATICIPTYLVINVYHLSPYYFFIIDASSALLIGVLYFYRFKTGRWKKNLLDLHTATI